MIEQLEMMIVAHGQISAKNNQHHLFEGELSQA